MNDITRMARFIWPIGLQKMPFDDAFDEAAQGHVNCIFALKKCYKVAEAILKAQKEAVEDIDVLEAEAHIKRLLRNG